MHRDRNGLEVLDRPACLALLAGATLGRVGINSQALPAVLPVTYKLVGEDIVFSTSAGAKLCAATDHAVIAFEVDQFDALAHAGWSVLVTGIALPVTEVVLEERLRRAGVPRWIGGDGARFVVLGTERVSGRRLGGEGVGGGRQWATMNA
jgi:uncharacterized protein